MFGVYFGFGFGHLLDARAYDHLLFLAALCAGSAPAQWRSTLLLVTAFTAGHTLSLALATLDIVRAPSAWVEFLVLATVVVAAAANVAPLVRRASAGVVERSSAASERRALRARYAMALVFGAVHGLGFSNFLRAALGSERSLFLPLVSFNLGLEVAQIIVVGTMTLFAFVIVQRLGVSERAWTLGLSMPAGFVAAVAAVRRWPL